MKQIKIILLISIALMIGSIVNAQWTQIGQNIDGEAVGNRFGCSVSINSNGTIVAIGAERNDGGNGIYSHTGHVRVYKDSLGTWTQIGNDIDGEAAEDYFGSSVSINNDGTIIAIGAPYNDGLDTNAGHVRIYENVSGIWTQIGNDIDGEAKNDYSGSSVSLSADGTIVAIGSPYNDGNGSSAGHVRVYENIAGTWTQIGNDIDGEAAGDLSGCSISLSGDGTVVAIGAEKNDASATNAGHVRIYKNIVGTWTQIGNDIDGDTNEDRFGHSVNINTRGDTIVIGAPYFDEGLYTNSGLVRVFYYNSNTWIQLGTDILVGSSYAEIGHLVRISSDGKTVVVGNNGALSPFKYNGVSWDNGGNFINVGKIFSINFDGSIIAIGNPDEVSSKGRVRIYNYIVGIHEIKTNTISIFPNPAKNKITLKGKNIEAKEIRIYNILGQDLTLSVSVISKTKEFLVFDISSLNAGVYFVTNKNIVTKFIKK